MLTEPGRFTTKEAALGSFWGTRDAQQRQAAEVDQDRLVAAAQRGDVESFNQLVRAYQHFVYRLAFRVLGDEDSAADATQDTFISAYKHIRAFRGVNFKGWLGRIATNACYDQLRTKRRRPSTSIDEWLEQPDDSMMRWAEDRRESPLEFVERQELQAIIQKGLAGLPPDYRLALVLCDIEGLHYDEVVQMTGWNLGTVKSRLSRARGRMRQYLLAQTA